MDKSSNFSIQAPRSCPIKNQWSLQKLIKKNEQAQLKPKKPSYTSNSSENNAYKNKKPYGDGSSIKCQVCGNMAMVLKRFFNSGTYFLVKLDLNPL